MVNIFNIVNIGKVVQWFDNPIKNQYNLFFKLFYTLFPQLFPVFGC